MHPYVIICIRAYSYASVTYPYAPTCALIRLYLYYASARQYPTHSFQEHNQKCAHAKISKNTIAIGITTSLQIQLRIETRPQSLKGQTITLWWPKAPGAWMGLGPEGATRTMSASRARGRPPRGLEGDQHRESRRCRRGAWGRGRGGGGRGRDRLGGDKNREEKHERQSPNILNKVPTKAY